ncbi:MAG TPA: ABC transporter substrate-binding protein [Clostridiaceae bacterium]|nr:ABC transporter substrate-binding protein [Clostridiaceae bacterium]
MKKFKLFQITLILVIFAIALAACSTTDSGNETNPPADNETTVLPDETDAGDETDAAEETDETQETDAPEETDAPPLTEVEIVDAHGTIIVPVNPQTVVSLDNRTFETLSDWGISLAAVPKAVMPEDSPYVADDSVLDIGDHREPKLELLAAADPDLVIVGQRFAAFYEDIKELVPNATVIDLTFDVSEESDTAGMNLYNGLIDATLNLGKIFDKNDEAQALVDEFTLLVADVKEAYNGSDTILSVVVSGGNIGNSAPGSGRVWGPLYELFDWVPALQVEGSTSDHQGDDISDESIAQSNPDWIMVLDRDAAVSSTADATPAEDVIDNAPALQKVSAIVEDQVIYAPNDTYTNESIETFIELFQNLLAAFSK